MAKHYLYRHIRLDTGQPFYIGIGTKRESRPYYTYPAEYPRAYSKSGRTEYWKRITSKSEYDVEILFESDDYELIKQKEIEFIALYGRRNKGKGILCNLTDGGDGVLGIIRSQETSDKISKANTGRKTSDETKLKQSLVKKGKKMSEHTIELRKGCMPTGENHAGARLLINHQTGIYYSTVKEASEAYGINSSTLANMLSGHRRNYTDLVYAESNSKTNYPILPKIKEYASRKHTEESKAKLSKAKKGRFTGSECNSAKSVTDIVTGVQYSCIKEEAEKLGHNYGYLCSMLNPNTSKKNKTSLIYTN